MQSLTTASAHSQLGIPREHALIARASQFSVPAATATISVSPVILPVPDRAVDLELRVTAPVEGGRFPTILLSHGHGASNNLASLNGYGPLATFYAGHGFAVIQPTHLNSKALSLDPNGPEGGLFWHSRAKDMHVILDRLAEIEAAIPHKHIEFDRDRIVAVGHSLGGHTVGMLAGMRVTDPVTGEVVDLSDKRIRASVLLGAPGDGVDLAAPAAGRFPVLKNNSFKQMSGPALVVAGDKDQSPTFSERPDWRSDAYRLSPGPKCLLIIAGGEHLLGGINGYDAAETTDENPERAALVERITWAYSWSALHPEDPAWQNARAELARNGDLGTIECKA